MTLRDSSVRKGIQRSDRSFGGRLRDKRRRKDRRLLSESLEQRQLLAGPDLIGIQPNEGSLLREGTVLNVSPRELVFRFDDNTTIDESSLSAIRITRAGEDRVFESATATSDLGTNGDVLVEFRARSAGSVGNGIVVQLTSESRTGSSLPLVSVSDQTVTINANSNPLQPTRVQDLISAVAANAEASALLEVIQVSGPSLGDVGTRVPDGLTLTLTGANAAQAVTDFGTGGEVQVRLVSQLPGVDGRGTVLQIERRNFGGQANPVVVVTDQTIRVQLNSSAGFQTTAQEFINAINSNPDASRLVSASLEQGSGSFRVGAVTTPLQPLPLSGVSDVVVEPGFVGLGDSPREVLFRFAEPLPDDIYQIDILGNGPIALRNTDGELFRDGEDLTQTFRINLGPKVVAVVPEPVRRNANGDLVPETGRIEVHFNDDDLDRNLAQTPGFYQLVYTRDTVNNTDDLVVNPVSVAYNNVTNIATLNFGRPLSRFFDPDNAGRFVSGAAMLRVGTAITDTRTQLRKYVNLADPDNSAGPTPPTEISLVLNPNNVAEPGDTFDSAFDLTNPNPSDPNAGRWSADLTLDTHQSARLKGEIFNTEPFELNLPGPDLPGTRDIRPDDPSRLLRTVPLDYLRNGADVVDGISVVQYDFANSWLGDDPNQPGILEDRTYFNVISEQQKQRVREVMQLYSEYLGISFVEVEGAPTSAAFISIAVGDLYGGDERATSGDGGLAVVTRDRNGDGIDDLGVMDLQDFDESIDDQFGGEFFRGAMFAVGQLLGYGFADDLPQPVTQSTDFIFAPGSDNEPAFPSVADIVHGQFLYRPDSTDVDLYRFELKNRGTLSIESIAERLATPSLLDTTLRLYRMDGSGGFEEIASNDDYFSNDSSINLEVEAGTFIVGVSARGNSDYDPNIENSGFGGLTEGDYELVLDFRPATTNSILDTTGVALDGDNDGRPGGVADFWFVPADSNTTLYVDKASAGSGPLLGTVGNPYNEIDRAIAAADPGDTIRVVGNGGVDGKLETPGDNFSYRIGFASNGVPLEDGSTLNLPRGVRMVIDSGAILKMSGARIGVGSVSPLIDVSDSSLQILGTPTIVTAAGLPARDATNTVIPGSVYLTSVNDDSVGTGNSAAFTPAPRPGDWGGIDFRADLDGDDESRRNRELDGVFLNHVQYADLRYGGGAVSIGGRQAVVSPIDMAVTRPTIINSRITDSADAAMSATPDTFAETRFTDPQSQASGAFTPTYDRVGPRISGNLIEGNSINGLFVRVATRTGSVLETIETSARFDDTDITHVLTENLVVEGTPGGPILQSSAPSSLLVSLQPNSIGNVAAGTYVYRITNVSSSGLESAASQPTASVTLNATGGIRLNQLPTVGVGSEFASRRLYRATVDPTTGLPGEFRLVGQLNASNTSFTDVVANGSTVLSTADAVLRSRLDASLAIDPGTVVKLDGARIEARFGANLIAEGSESLPVVFTSLEDQRYGAGGTFDTNDRGNADALNPGDWGGIYVGQGASASIDQAVIAGAGGTTRIEGGFASFNPVEVHQGTLRLANSRFDQNADGRGDPAGDRVGRSDNEAATIFVRAAAPVIVNNKFIDGAAAPISVDVNSLSSNEVSDHGRATGRIDSMDVVGNVGPLVQGNVLSNNDVNGLQVRGGQLATTGVWDDVDIVHVVNESIEIPNQHIFGGLRLQSDARGSLVVKFESAENENAGIVVGGTLLSGQEQFRDIPDRIGGSLQVIGHPDFPVVLTTLGDDTSGAGFTLTGRPQLDTNNDGVLGDDLTDQIGGSFRRFPAGPEVNRGNTIDNDVDVNTPGFFEATPGNGHLTTASGVTVNDAVSGQVAVNQDFFFEHSTFVIVNGVGTRLSATTVNQPATLIGDDLVESRGSFAGPNGTVDWVAQTTFRDGVAVMFSSLELTAAAGTQLGDVRVVNFFHPDIGSPGQENVYPFGAPGSPEFRAVTYQVNQRFGFGHGGFYVDDDVNLSNATYAGWAADTFANLEADIAANVVTFTPPGVIDTTTLPPIVDPRIGNVFGTGDVNTAFAWDVDATAVSSLVTSFVELIEDEPGNRSQVARAQPGLWDGVLVREAAHDRNVAAFAEQEPVRSSIIDSNAIPSQSQFLGEIAPNEQSGDENRRLGFVVDGTIAERDDIDVYSFVAQSGTEVWLDIDRTGNQLDSVVELIDANGRVLAASNDSLLSETDPLALFVNTSAGVNPDAAQPLSVVAERISSQQITVSESIVDATGGSLALTIAGNSGTASVSADAFLADPAAAVASALQSTFPTLGPITATLLRRTERQIDPDDPSNIIRFGDQYKIQLRFDADRFIGRTVPAISVDASGITGTGVIASAAEVLLGSQLQDDYSSNPKDAGMRIRLPGEAGTRNLYHVRVRSSNTRNPLDFGTLDSQGNITGGLGDPNHLRDGLSKGRYELQIRLQEADEHAGTQLRLADVRYATNGLHIVGQPLHSPLLGEEQEIAGDNDSLANAQPLGYFSAANDGTLGEAGPLQSDQLAKSFAGRLESATDVDWYRFEVNYEDLTRDAAALYLSTVFDLDYASGFARSDMAMYVFDAQGQLVLVGGDSNIADDLPQSTTNNNTEDLSRGSAGSEDPYIGAQELSEGTYFVAISNQQAVPLPLDQFFNANSANPLLRLEPVDSVRRIAEDHIGSSGGGTAGSPTVPLLFDNESIVDFTFDDTLLYVNTGNSLHVVNPFTGQRYFVDNSSTDSLGDFGGEFIRDVAFRANGELFGYTDNDPASDTSSDYVRIDTANANLTTISSGMGISTFHLTNFDPTNLVLDAASNSGIQVEAITIREFQGAEEGYLVGNRPVAEAGLSYSTNILYDFNDETGLVAGPAFALSRFDAGAGTTPREVGQINTSSAGRARTRLGITDATEINRNGLAVQSLADGDTFTITDLVDSVTFELDQGFTLIANGNQPVRDGDAIVVDGVTFEFNTGARIRLSDVSPTGTLTDGSTVTVEGTDGGLTTFEFVRFGNPQAGNEGIRLVDGQGIARSMDSIAAELAAAINFNVVGVAAASQGGEVVFDDAPLSLTQTGSGITFIGDTTLNNAGAVAVDVPETITPDQLIDRLADAIRGAGLAVSAAGNQLALPSAAAVTIQTNPSGATSALTLSGAPGVSGAGNVAILLLPTDTAETLAARISIAVQAASDAGDLSNVSAIPDGRSLNIVGGEVVSATGNLSAGGAPMDGLVTGIEIVNDNLYAVTNAGGLYQVRSGDLDSNGNNNAIAQYLGTSTDLIGINFTGLRAGPQTVENGALSEILFGITGSGDVYAFNLRGELQTVFAGGRSVISTGVSGALGLDFSVVDFNLFHVTDTRDTDAGHGINPLFNGTRSRTNGGNSLAFNYENDNFGGLFPALVEQPTFSARQDGTAIERTFNIPGGAKGIVQSNSFSLEGFASDDEPVMYFNYFAENDGTDDRLRIYVVTEAGAQHLVASNTLARDTGSADDEFDDPPRSGIYNDQIDVDVQQLFDNTGTWRQARVPLREFVGEANLSLRIEFSTRGTTSTTTESIRTVSGAALAQTIDRTVVIRSAAGGSETFELDLAPAISFPSGSQLASLYVDPTEVAIVNIDGQEYVLDNGTRVVDTTTQIRIDLLSGQPAGTTLSDLSAADIADAVANQIQANLPPSQEVTGFDFSDATDDPTVTAGRNDLLFQATPLPYSGGNMTISGTGRLGTNNNPGLPPTDLDDVDIVRAEVVAGSLITVDVTLDFNSALRAAVRFFNESGTELNSTVNANGDVQLTAPEDGVIFIGISGLGNETYDPQIPGTAQVGQVDSYTASVSISVPTSYRAIGSVVEFEGGQQSIDATPSDLFQVNRRSSGVGVTVVPVNRFMSAEDVANQLRRAVAGRFFEGNVDALPASGASVRLPALTVIEAGPFANEGERFGDRFGATIEEGARNNAFEGLYLDDFIIGFAERGEIATGSNVVNSPFVTDTRPQFPNPDDPTTDLVTGTYQVEIRSASEYVRSASSTRFRTFDTNVRLSDARTLEARSAAEIRDGSTFSISDGRSTLTFEFDLEESNTGVTSGRVRVPFTLQSDTGPQTAAEVAANIVAAINRDDVQAVIDVPAQLADGVDGASSATVNLFGDVVVNNDGDALASVGRSVLRGDENRDRGGQGVILVENSRFLLNENYGIAVSHGLSAQVDGQETPSIVRYPRNLVELNSENLVPGVVIQSNILAFNGDGGLQIDGVGIGVNDTTSDPVAYDRIVNNTIVGGTIFPGIESPPATFQGVLFPQGQTSFADSVVSYAPDADGSPPAFGFQDPDQALGAPDGTGRGAEPTDGSTTVSLGLGGTLTLQFEDNLLTGSGDARPDLIVFETGAIESVMVEISRDGSQFTTIGNVGGLTNQVDIDAFGFGTEDRFAFVRLTDLRQGDLSNAPLGADIDAVGALSSVAVESFTAGGSGIEILGNAAPVLLNNVIANTENGLQVSSANTMPVLGGNTYYRNTNDVPAGISLGQFSQRLSDAEVVFVGAGDLVFSPAAGSSIIDSSIDSLEDRSSLTAVKNPLGLPPSPILAPNLDVNGQLRVDDPNVETPSGLGERVFKDRGAADRGDLVGPRAVLLTPSAPNLGFDAGVVSVLGDAPPFFEIQLIDGIAPADVTPGTGIDDRSVSNGSVVLLKDAVALVEGVDYRFGYNPSTNVIRLTPIAGVFEQDSTYVIRLIDATDAIVQAGSASTITDGAVLNVLDSLGATTGFEYETGFTLTVRSGTLASGTADGIVISAFDGTSSMSFELDSDQNVASGNVAVTIPAAGNDSQVAEAIAATINSSSLNLTATTDDALVRLLGSNPLSTVTTSNNRITVSGSIGTSVGFGLQVPANGSAVSSAVADGQTFTIRRGSSSVTFELDTNGSAGGNAVSFSPGASLDDIADAIVRAVGGAGLGLSPFNAGFGRVALGGDANYALDVSGTALVATGFPGQSPTIPMVIGLDQTPTGVAQTISNAINGANLAGVSTSVVDTRVFAEGTGGVNGTGAVDTVTVRDEVGNLLQSNQSNGRTELTVFVGGGFDYGDAPAPYISLDVDGGPRHAVDPNLRLGSDVSPDSDARLNNADDDDGVSIGAIRAGFDVNVTLDITDNTNDGQPFFLDAWFDWNGDGIFEDNSEEIMRFNSATSALASGPNNSILVRVPGDAQVGETFARFRLSKEANLPPTGEASIGEVEDYRIVVTSNPFQNPSSIIVNVNGQPVDFGRFDVNNSGAVTPLDALQIINAIDRNGGDINLSEFPLPAGIPPFPDTDGNGLATAKDALDVITAISTITAAQAAEGEATGFVPLANGVLASRSTVVGDALLADASRSRDRVVEEVSTIDPPEQKTSVFDSAPVVAMDEIVDALAEDTAATRNEDDPTGALDQLFASL